MATIEKEKCLSNISKFQSSFQSMEVRNANFTAFIDVLTPNTYIMVIMSDPTIRNLSLIETTSQTNNNKSKRKQRNKQ